MTTARRAERVLLIHGLWMHALALRPLARRLVRAGYEVELIGYPSILRGPEPALRAISRALRRRPDRTTHLVGHSLGGVIAVRAARDAGSEFRGRIVGLGSPLAGSSVARALMQRGGWRALLAGQSAEMLGEGAGPLPDGVQVGIIAGNRAFGLGRLLHRLAGPNDGTVLISETRVPGLAAHREFDSTHTGLAFGAAVARAVVQFLREGRFDSPPAADRNAAAGC